MLFKKNSAFYKNPALVLVVLFPLTAVIVGIIFIFYSIKTYDGVVIDDYYKKGKHINQTLERDEMASRLGLSAQLMLDEDRKLIRLDLDAQTDFEYPEKVSLDFIHRTIGNRDLNLELVHQSDNQYLVVLPDIDPSHWQLELGTDQWRLKGKINIPDENQSALTVKPR